MRLAILLLPALVIATGALAAPPAKPSPADKTAIFKAAGFKRTGGQWKSDCGDPGTMSYAPGTIEVFRDINGDGRPEAVVTEGGDYCYGNTGTGFWLLSKQASGAWKLMAKETGMADFLMTKGAGGWPDISVGGPSFCFPVLRWNGSAYTLNRREYEGKRCR